ALNTYPEQYRKLCANPKLVESMIPEIIRWQTPVMSMRRTALEDSELGGQIIRKGEKLVMWYYSGNRDEEVIENAEELVIDRARPRQHLSFGFGIHRCVGNRLAELQLKILWEEAIKRWPEPGQIEVVTQPERATTYAIRNYKSMPVRINA
ncbi:MAG: cytochrome P450, partial [Porticoccaceae bacterium]